MNNDAEMSLSEERSRLLRRADQTRARFLRTIDALGERGKQIKDVGGYAKKFAFPVAATFVGVAALAAGATLGVRALAKRRKNKALGRRLGETIVPIRRAIVGERRPTVFEEAFRRAAVSALTVVMSELARRSLKNVMNGRLPGGQPLPTHGYLPDLGVTVVDAPRLSERRGRQVRKGE